MAQLTEAQRRAFEALRMSYESELPDKLGRIARAAAALDAHRYDRARLRYLHRHVHQLAGSAGIFGFAALSRCAAALEALTASALEGSRPLSAETCLAFVRRLLVLRRAPVSVPEGARVRRRRLGGTGPGSDSHRRHAGRRHRPQYS